MAGGCLKLGGLRTRCKRVQLPCPLEFPADSGKYLGFRTHSPNGVDRKYKKLKISQIFGMANEVFKLNVFRLKQGSLDRG